MRGYFKRGGGTRTRLGLGNALSKSRRSLPRSLFSNNKSLNFDGTDDYVDLGNDFQSITEGGTRTVSAWVKAASTDPTDEANRGRIFTMYRANDSTSFAIHAEGSSAPANWYCMYRRTGNVFVNVNSGVNITTEWTHLALTQNNSDLKFYINGAVQASKTDATYDWSASSPAVIGAHLTASTNNQEFSGNIDEVAIWNTALDADAITAIYNSGTPISLSSDSGDYDNSSNLQGYWRMGDGTLDTYPLIADQTNATLGSNLITNGDFSGGLVGDWAVGGAPANWSVVDGQLVAAGSSANLQYNSHPVYPISSGALYKVTYDLTVSSGLTPTWKVGNGSTVTPTQGTNQVSYCVAGSVGYHVVQLSTHSSFQGTVDNISVNKVNGNAGLMTNMVSGDIEEETP